MTRSVSRSGQYSYALPSIDWSAELTTQTKVRASYGQTIGRPGWSAIQGGRTLNSLARIDGEAHPTQRPRRDTAVAREVDREILDLEQRAHRERSVPIMSRSASPRNSIPTSVTWWATRSGLLTRCPTPARSN